MVMEAHQADLAWEATLQPFQGKPSRSTEQQSPSARSQCWDYMAPVLSITGVTSQVRLWRKLKCDYCKQGAKLSILFNYYYFFLVVLGVELEALYLLSRCSII
jgi:hypothetical protein